MIIKLLKATFKLLSRLNNFVTKNGKFGTLTQILNIVNTINVKYGCIMDYIIILN